jgi:general secretion pathway protein C
LRVSEITAAFEGKGPGAGAALSRFAAWRRNLRRRAAPPRQQPAGNAGPLRPAVAIVEAGLAVLIGIFAAKAFWALFAPLPAAPSVEVAPAPAATTAAAAINPFRLTLSAAAPAAVVEAPAAVETSLNLTLFGTWAVEAGGATAIISANGQAQKVYRIGEEICCGASLAAVYPDRVLISRAGARETLRLPNKSEAAAAPLGASAPASRATASLADLVTVRATTASNGAFALQLAPGSDPARFEDLGLRAGDLLVAIDGAPLSADPAATQRLLSNASGARTVTLTVERDGVSLPVEVDLGAAMAN